MIDIEFDTCSKLSEKFNDIKDEYVLDIISLKNLVKQKSEEVLTLSSEVKQKSEEAIT